MKKFLKNYSFLLCMLFGIVAGCVAGLIWPVVKDASGNTMVIRKRSGQNGTSAFEADYIYLMSR